MSRVLSLLLSSCTWIWEDQHNIRALRRALDLGHRQQYAASCPPCFPSSPAVMGTGGRQAPSTQQDTGIAVAGCSQPSCSSAPHSDGGKPSGLLSSQLGQAFQCSQAPTDFHFVSFKVDQAAVSFPMTFSCFILHPVQTLQTFSTRISQGKSFSLVAFREHWVMQGGWDCF